MFNFFAYIHKLKDIKRWSLMRNSEEENVKEHSFDVSVIAHAIAVIDNRIFGAKHDTGKITEMALFHETSEVITGDLPTPIKYYNDEIHNAYSKIEKIAQDSVFNMLPDVLKPEYREIIYHDDNPEYVIVKNADKISAYIKCLRELQAGNEEFRYAKDNLRKQIEQIEHGATVYFIENFLPAYSLTLDELNNKILK